MDHREHESVAVAVALKPYYSDELATIYHGDCRKILPQLVCDVVITDPPWIVKGKIAIEGNDRPGPLLAEAMAVLPKAKRLIVIIGDQSDPRILQAVPSSWPFLRMVLVRRTPPARRGSLCLLGDTAYVFGKGWLADNGKRLLTGMCEIATTVEDRKRSKHPCSRNIRGQRWLVARYTRSEHVVLDPFMGSGTTLIAAKYGGRKCIGIELEERWCEDAVKALRQTTIESVLSA